MKKGKNANTHKMKKDEKTLKKGVDRCGAFMYNTSSRREQDTLKAP